MRKALIVVTAVLMLTPAVATAQNTPPIADAGPDQVIISSVTVLQGAATDPDGDPILAWLWEVDSTPTGGTATIRWPDEPDPTLYVDLTGDYVLSLTVFDGVDWSDPDFVTVQRRDLLPPVAVINVDVTCGYAPLTVQFDGSDSTVDPVAGPLTYRWNFGDGDVTPAVSPSHTYELLGTYTAYLTLVDSLGQSDVETVEITVCGDGINCPPVADAGEDQTGYLNEPVQLSGAASDHDGDEIVSWAWSIESAPEGSSASFNDPSIPDPVFSPDLLGAYVLSLVVSDGEDTSESDTLTITVEEPPAGWGGASVVGMQSASPAKGLNYLIALLIPIGAVLLWKGLRKRE